MHVTDRTATLTQLKHATELVNVQNSASRLNCRETNVWFLSSLPGSSCCLNIWLKVQCSWQRFIVHSEYLQYNNIHTIVQVHMYSAEFSVQIPIPKCSFRFSCNCYLLVSIRVKLEHVWIPHWWMQHTSDKLDMFDLCLVISGRLKKHKSFQVVNLFGDERN